MKLKILIVGEFITEWKEKIVANELEKRNYQVDRFDISIFFENKTLLDYKKNIFDIKQIYFRIQNKYLFGPTIYKINKALKKTVGKTKYDFVFFQRPVLFYPSTFKFIKKHSIVITHNNDDPFTKYPITKNYWSKYLNSAIYFDHLFLFRQKNVEDFNKLNITNTSILKPFYIKSQSYPIGQTAEKNKTDVLFIGHFEDDGRDYLFYELLKRKINLKIFGTDWKLSKIYPQITKMLGYDIYPLRGTSYNEAINNTKIALVLFSKINNDTYTVRSFEIPATKTFMLSKRTDDMKNMFEEGSEADYFDDREELIEKINFYLKNEELREQIAQNGYNRLIKDGHEISNRVDTILEKFYEIKNKKQTITYDNRD